jgi:hypothetical protein
MTSRVQPETAPCVVTYRDQDEKTRTQEIRVPKEWYDATEADIKRLLVARIGKKIKTIVLFRFTENGGTT